MRKIEQQMVAAAKARRTWASDNTEVTVEHDRARVYLHRNHIADVMADGTVVPNRDTYRRWPTRTTASRLRALGVNAGSVKHQPTIDGEAL